MNQTIILQVPTNPTSGGFAFRIMVLWWGLGLIAIAVIFVIYRIRRNRKWHYTATPSMRTLLGGAYGACICVRFSTDFYKQVEAVSRETI